MELALDGRNSPVARRIGEVAGIRPVTLLIASGIVLIIAIMVATGIAANDLRRTSLTRNESELARLDAVLAAASIHWLNDADAQLQLIGDTILKAPPDVSPAGTSGQIEGLLASKLAQAPALAGIAAVAADGAVVAHAGAWPAGMILPSLTAATASPSAGGQILLPFHETRGGGDGIAIVHPLTGRPDAPIATVIGIPRLTDLTKLFEAVPLPPDATIALVRSDGTVLAQHPSPVASPGRIARQDALTAAFGNKPSTMIRQGVADDGVWRIEALYPLQPFSAALVLSRSADAILSDWTHQGMWFAVFALVVAAAIGIMVYLIARQFETHQALAAMRADNAIAAINAEKIEVERARLAVEAELLKSERLSVLGQLTATVAHELRNPLSAIRNTLFTIKELATGAAIKLDRPVNRMERSIERCDRIIADLLEYTRTRELTRTRLPFDSWLAEVAAEQNIAPPVELTVELAAGETEVPIDCDRMRRVVINLVENAVHALAEMPPDRDKRITLRTAVVDGELVLTIADTGPGIEPETLARIFEPLFSTKSFGTGLGLPTVKQIVNQHDGIITVDSTVGQGTSLCVRLPLATAAVLELEAVA